jgi:hypothetical protein
MQVPQQMAYIGKEMDLRTGSRCIRVIPALGIVNINFSHTDEI